MPRSSLLPFVAIATLACGCGKLTLDADTRATYEAIVRVSSGDPGKPVANANLLANGTKVGYTGPDGSATLKFVGNEGETYDIQVECPAGLQSPSKPIAITLRKIVSPSKRPEFAASCPPATQVMVVAVRADNGPNLPVLFLGKEVARTDASGAAHVALRMTPNDTFELKLGTDEKGSERLKPQNPTATFTVKDHDDIVPFDQKFTLDAPKRRVGKPKPSGPTRL
jgi:hypothetical protein